jgi:hypothetical protein
MFSVVPLHAPVMNGHSPSSHDHAPIPLLSQLTHASAPPISTSIDLISTRAQHACFSPSCTHPFWLPSAPTLLFTTLTTPLCHYSHARCFVSYTTIKFLILTLTTCSPFVIHHRDLVAGSFAHFLTLVGLNARHLTYRNINTHSALSKASNRPPAYLLNCLIV